VFQPLQASVLMWHPVRRGSAARYRSGRSAACSSREDTRPLLQVKREAGSEGIGWRLMHD